MAMHYDVLIKDTTIIDGTGRPAFMGSIGVAGAKIVAVGEVDADAARIIQGQGLVTCPGFVDSHCHADLTILEYPLAENLVMQGITTFVGGNCGWAMAPLKNTTYVAERLLERWSLDVEIDWRSFDEWLSKVEGQGLSLNYVPLVGHNTLRGAILGEDFRREASSDEIDAMKELAEEAMRSGAFGLSAGLDGVWPGHFAGVEEIVALAKVAEKHGGLFAPHTRHYQNQWPADVPEAYGYGVFHAPTGEIIAGRYHGLLEAIEISKKANRIPLHIAHLTPAYLVPQPHPGFLDEAVAKATLAQVVDKARAEGLDVTYNVIACSHSIGSQVPMIASFFSLQLLLPDWLRALSKAEFVERLASREFRDSVKEVFFSGTFKFDMLHPLVDPYWMDCYQILRCRNAAYAGKTIGEMARERQPGNVVKAVYEASVEVVFDLLMDDPDTTCALIIDKREHGVLPVFLKHPAGMPCTDVSALPGAPAKTLGVTPTAYALFPHYIEKYVKEQGVLSLEEAIRKATALPAKKVFGLRDRGTIQEGAYADLVMFDLEKIGGGNDFFKPAQPPEGIERVLVNGTVVWEDKKHNGKRPGRVIRRA